MRGSFASGEGFMTKFKRHLILILLFSATPPILSAAPSDLSLGQKLYENRCLRCHGINAKGSLTAAKNLNLDPLKLDLTREPVVRKTRKTLEKFIASGHGKMPKQEKLTSQQIQRVLKYLETLQKAYVMGKSSK
jgi:mono/diheme cytochrome c family protein